MSIFYKINFADGKTRIATNLSTLQTMTNDAYAARNRHDLIVTDLDAFTDLMLNNPYAAANANVEIVREEPFALINEAKRQLAKHKAEVERYDEFIKCAAFELIRDDASLATFLDETDSIAAHVKAWVKSDEKKHAIVEHFIKARKEQDEIDAQAKTVSAAIAKQFKTMTDDAVKDAFASVDIDVLKAPIARGNGGFKTVANAKRSKNVGAFLRNRLDLDSLRDLATRIGCEAAA